MQSALQPEELFLLENLCYDSKVLLKALSLPGRNLKAHKIKHLHDSYLENTWGSIREDFSYLTAQLSLYVCCKKLKAVSKNKVIGTLSR